MVSTFPEALQYQGQQNLIQALKMIVAQRLVPSLDGKRIALREYLVFTKEVKDKLALSKNIAQDAMALVSEFGVSMAEDAESKYNMGLISREEYERIQINYEE
jgi:defect-in-organelle-trafficking protein DotB